MVLIIYSKRDLIREFVDHERQVDYCYQREVFRAYEWIRKHYWLIDELENIPEHH